MSTDAQLHNVSKKTFIRLETQKLYLKPLLNYATKFYCGYWYSSIFYLLERPWNGAKPPMPAMWRHYLARFGSNRARGK